MLACGAVSAKLSSIGAIVTAPAAAIRERL
jgi:hypothetical protein